MKIALYFYQLANSSGGAEKMLVRLADEFTSRGHQVVVFSWDEPGAKAFFEISPEIRWQQLGPGVGPLKKGRRFLALFQALRREKPDVLIGFVMGADKIVYASCLLAGVPIVAAERNSPSMYARKLSRVYRELYLNLFRFCARVVVQLESYRRGYPEAIRTKVRTIPNPVLIPQTRANPDRSASGSGFILLGVGRLDPQKNFFCLIRAFALVSSRFENWKLRIFGSGPDREALADLVRQLGLSERVSLVDAKSDLLQCYLEANLFVTSSRWEGFPNALAEAMAVGLPAVGFSECDGVNELVVHERTGLLARGGDDPACLAESLGVLMGDSILRAEYGERAREAMRKFEPTRVFDQWESLLSEVRSGVWARPL